MFTYKAEGLDYAMCAQSGSCNVAEPEFQGKPGFVCSVDKFFNVRFII